MQCVLRKKGVVARWQVAVQTLTMSVEHGECFGMLGPNGAGKTTLINMLVGFMRPTRGGARVCRNAHASTSDPACPNTRPFMSEHQTRHAEFRASMVTRARVALQECLGGRAHAVWQLRE